MATLATDSPDRTQHVSHWHIGRPPIPHEHGAWFMLLIPLSIPFMATDAIPLQPALALLLVALSAFMGQNAFRLASKPRRRPGHLFWLAIYAIALAIGVTTLIIIFGYHEIILIGTIGFSIYLVAILIGRRSRGRFDRSITGEVMGVAALALTAPASHLIIHRELSPIAWIIYAVAVIYFISGVVFVNMLLTGARVPGVLGSQRKLKIGAINGAYHTVLLLSATILILWTPSWTNVFLLLAFVPVVVRSFHGWATLTTELPALAKVGIREAVYSVWFALFAQAAIRSLA
ncbi:MAG: YwiC-like family protein [Candidatus Latescibacteria bacterium]|jgi:hypothetical protein|nr:YwiC-like family protein [Candidatus Latescibacterota bacterium]